MSKYPDVKMASLMIEVSKYPDDEAGEVSKYPDDEAAALKLEVALDVDVGVAETVSDTSLKTDVFGCTVGFAEVVAIAAVEEEEEEEVIVEKIALLIEVSKYAVADADAAVADDNTSLNIDESRYALGAADAAGAEMVVKSTALRVEVSKYLDVGAIDWEGIVVLNIEVSEYALMTPTATRDTVEAVGIELMIEVSRYSIEAGPLKISWLVVVTVGVGNTVTAAESK